MQAVEPRDALALLAEEQAALRRVATLVARESSPADIFGAVTEEACRVMGSEAVGLLRFEADETATLLAQSDTPWDPPPQGTRFPLDGENLVTRVFRTGQTARVDDWTDSTGAVAAMVNVLGVRSAVAAPVAVEGSLWGTIIVASSQSEPLPAETETRIEQFTGLVATAIANAEARGALSRLAEEQSALRRVATLVAQDTAPAEIFAVVSVEVARVFGFDPDPASPDIAGVVRFEPGPALVPVGASKLSEAVKLGVRFPPDELYVSSHVLRTGRSARIGANDLDSVGGETADWLRHYGLLSQVGSPIVVEGHLWGAMTVNSGYDFPADTEERLERFTELIATAISNAESHDALARMANEQAALRRVATLVARGVGPEEVFRAVAGEVGAIFGADVAAIVRFESEGTATVLGDVGGPHESGKRVSLDEGYVVHQVRQTGRSARFDTDDPLAADMPSLVQALGIRSSVASPIVVEGELWGAITAASVEGPLPPSAERRLTEFTDLVATAAANTQARVAVQEAAAEQGALRRVATLVAASAAPSDVFDAVTREIGLVLGSDVTLLCRADSDGAVIVGTWVDDVPAPGLGTRLPRGGTNLTTIVLETGHSARIGSYEEGTGDAANIARSHGLRSAVGAPILVEGRLWGLVIAGTARDKTLPADAEERLVGFTELVATAIANAQAQSDLKSLAEQQAALRRVATLVARRATPEVVFRAVADEAGGLLGADVSALVRFESDDTVTVIGAPAPGPHEAGDRLAIDPRFVVEAVRATAGPARFETDDPAAEDMPEIVRTLGIRSAVASPVVVEGALWGAVVLGAFGGPFPPDTEQRLDEFTELVATAISNATARAELLASRVRLVAAGDEARRRIERNLHDGAQQRLVALGLDVLKVRDTIPEDRRDTHSALMRVEQDVETIMEELRELSHGLHPPLLSRLGLGPSVEALARRSPIPVRLDIRLPERPDASTETAMYYVVSEVVTNAIKHSRASEISVTIAIGEAGVLSTIIDDGIGGADPTRGSGLAGLVDRVDALGGRFTVDSPRGGGTRVDVQLPVESPLAS